MIDLTYLILGFVLGAGALALYFLPLKAEVDKQHMTLREEAARLRAETDSLKRQMAQRPEDEKMLMERFENLSNKIFEAKGEKFRQQSQEGLNTLLAPLKEKINEFQKKVDDSFGEQAKEQRSLKDQIKNIVELNTNITLQAENLANALKGESKIQGSWGEYILEKILEDSGLRKDEDYTAEGAGLGLVDQEGRRQKPDVVIRLPEGKHILIDSKLPLTSYERFFSETDDALRPAHLKAFIESVRARVRELEQTAYQDNKKLDTPDFVLMFVAIEGAYALAVQEDAGLHEYAWGKRVVVVCPTTLFATMKTVASIWRLERQNRNVQEIARQGGALYDKFAGFISDMSSLGTHIEKLEVVYDNAMKKLSKGRGNIISSVEKLKELGAKTTKSLPADLSAEDDDAETAALTDETKENLDRDTGT